MPLGRNQADGRCTGKTLGSQLLWSLCWGKIHQAHQSWKAVSNETRLLESTTLITRHL